MSQVQTLSSREHTPSPHDVGQAPQSKSQVTQFSPENASQTPSPHPTQGPQSAGHDMQLSPPATLQSKSPHTTVPQSTRQSAIASATQSPSQPDPQHAGSIMQTRFVHMSQDVS